MCRCAERRAAFTAGAKAAVAGDIDKVREQLAMIAQLTVEDAASVTNDLRTRAAAARSRLMGR